MFRNCSLFAQWTNKLSNRSKIGYQNQWKTLQCEIAIIDIYNVSWLLLIINTFNRNIKSTVMEMALIEMFCSYHVNKMKRCHSSHWLLLLLLHYNETFDISWWIEPVKHLLDWKWYSLLNSSFVCQILTVEWKDKEKVIKAQILQYFNFHVFHWSIFNTLILDRVKPIFKKRLTLWALISLNVTSETCSKT